MMIIHIIPLVVVGYFLNICLFFVSRKENSRLRPPRSTWRSYVATGRKKKLPPRPRPLPANAAPYSTEKYSKLELHQNLQIENPAVN